MAINIVGPLTRAEYYQLLKPLIVLLEESGEENPKPYFDDQGIATIGAGFNIRLMDKQDLVFSAMGLTAAQIVAAREAIRSATTENQLIQKLDAAIGREFRMTEPQIAQVFEQLAATFTNTVMAETGLGYSRELLAIVSLHYNGAYAQTNLAQLLLLPDPVEARIRTWFEISYFRNPTPEVDGKQKRRYMEASIFGLYDNPGSVSAEYARSIYDILLSSRVGASNSALIREGVLGKEGRINQRALSLANSDLASINFPTSAKRISEALAPAQAAFINWANSVRDQDAPEITLDLIPNPMAIFFKSILAADHILDARGDDSRYQSGINKNLLVGSSDEDQLFGGGGSDYLLGLDGNDVLTGGLGRDILVGGKGIDTYVWNVGDGVDKITETDEVENDEGGRLRLNGSVISRVVRDDATGFYKSGEFVFVDIASMLFVYTEGGNQVLTIKNYNRESNNFGIEWTDEPPPAGSGSDGSEAASQAGGASFPPVYHDPLALDLDGDGIETAGILNGNAVLFDHDADGIRTGTGWVKGDDGWLVMDRNGNGLIDNGRELFGVDTLLQNGNHASDGFSALREWDTDADGKITSADAVFTNLRIWRDLNQDGITQAGELQTLADQNIVSINVNGTPGTTTLPGGNIQTAAGAFTRADGSTGTTGQIDSLAANLDLLSNTFYRKYTDSIPLTTAAAALPDIGGSGRVRNLREAASLSPTFTTLMQDYAQQASRAGQVSRLDSLLSAWTATSDLGSLKSQYATLNAQGNPATLTYNLPGYTPGTAAYDEMVRRIGVVECFMGFTYTGNGTRTTAVDMSAGNTTVSFVEVQVQAINSAYEIFRADIYSALLLQTRLKPYADAIQYQSVNDDLVVNFAPVEALFNQAIANNADAGVMDLLEFVSAFGAGTLLALGWDALPFLSHKLSLSPSIAGFAEKITGDSLLHVADGSQYFVQGTGRNDFLVAASQSTSLFEYRGKNTLVGREGDDILNGGTGNDILYGGTGSDVLAGGAGSNTYIYVAGEGADHIYNITGELETVDTVRIHGALPTQVTVSRSYDILVLTFAGYPGSLSVHDFFSSNGEDYQALDSIVFDDGTVWSVEDVRAPLMVTGSGNDVVEGFAPSELIHGQAGNDTLSGFGGNDELYGDDGADILNGGVGDDLLQGGAGHDELYGDDGSDLILGDADSDYLYGGAGDDTLEGGAGNDYLQGGTGANTYVFGRGDGVDLLGNSYGTTPVADLGADTLLLRDLAFEDVVFSNAGGETLVIRIKDSEDQFVVPNYFKVGAAGNVPLGRIVTELDGRELLPAEVLAIVMTKTSGDDTLFGLSTDDVLDGGDGNDSINGWYGNDTLEGGNGNDTVDGGAGNDVVHGGAGNDLLLGWLGDDIFHFGIGDGLDTIGRPDIQWNESGSDVLVLDNLLPSDIHVERVSNTWVAINIVGTDDHVLIPKVAPGGAGVQTVRFANGVEWTAQDLLNRVALTAGNDVIYGSIDNNNFDLLGGDDFVDGGDGDDTLVGGVGSDQLYGGRGNDILDGDSSSATADGNADTLRGGVGDDSYRLRENIDQIIELAGEGRDTVYRYASGTWTLPDNIEILRLMTQNAGNQITANALDNEIYAGLLDMSHKTNSALGVDVLIGGAGNDNYYDVFYNDVVVEAAGGGIDTVYVVRSGYVMAANVENAVASGGPEHNGKSIVGNELDNQITDATNEGGAFYGGLGNDTLTGAWGAISLYGEQGDDVLYGSTKSDTLDGGQGNNYLDAGYGADYLYANGSHDIVIGNLGNDEIFLGAGVADCIFGSQSGTDRIQTGTGSFSLSFTASTLGDITQVISSNGYLQITYKESAGESWATNHLLISLGGLEGLTSVSTLDGTLSAAAFYQWLGGAPSVYQANYHLTLTGGSSKRYSAIRSGNDVIFQAVPSAPGDFSSFAIVGGTPVDPYRIEANGRDLRAIGAGPGVASIALDFGSGYIRHVHAGTDGSDDFAAQDGLGQRDWYFGGLGADTYHFGLGSGEDLVDVLASDTAQDIIEIGVLRAEANIYRNYDDSLIVSLSDNSQLVVMDFFKGLGVTPLLRFSNGETYTLASYYFYTYGATTGNDTITGTADDNNMYGWLGNDTLNGLGGNDEINGGEGADQMSGGAGNDLYTVDNTGDVVIEQANGGEDTVLASINLVLAANVEIGVLSGAAHLSVTGNSLNNLLNGNDGNNRLDGGAGADYMFGGLGDDTYVVDNATTAVSAYGYTYTGDFIEEWEVNSGTGGGIDTVESSVAYTLGAYLENLTLTGSGNIAGTGNELDNVLRGNAGTNALKGKAGNDTYYVSTGDTVTENANEGTDLVISDVTWTLASTANVENLTLSGTGNINATGNTLANILVGNAGNNTLDGGTGADTLQGGSGNDTYTVDNAGDVVVELAGEGSDTIQTGMTWSLAAIANVENLTLTGTSNINATGNALANVLTGNSGTNTLTGGAGNDTYVVTTGDVVVENANEGIDTIQSSVTWTLASLANVENLTLIGTSAINATGNALDNVLVGNSGTNTLTGGAGNDTYYVSTGDTVTEAAGGGTDTVISDITWTLASTTNIENLTLSGTGNINATGNALTNILIGNAGNNTLDGGTGTDTLQGGQGNDSYTVDNAGDVVVELSGEGTDLVNASVSYTLSANVENLTLSGSSNINATGNALDNVLTGNTGTNTLTGGAGNDTYVVTAGDVVVENAGEGTDTVQSGITWTLASTANVENLTLTGTSNINATGNALDNVLTGNSGTNTLTGGAGNDTYVVTTGDVVVENAGEGIDTIQSSVTWTLASLANVENLTLTGSSAINATGNALDNVLTGNSGTNTLTGGAGNDTYYVSTGDTVTEAAGGGTDTVISDVTWTLASTTNIENLMLSGTAAINATGNTLANTLRGNAGNNTLTGAAGNDTYLFGLGGASDTIVDSDSTSGNADKLLFDAGTAYDQLWFKHTGSNLEVSIIGTNDKITISNWYGGTANHVERIQMADGRYLTDGNVEALVQAMAGMTAPALGQTSLTTAQHQQLDAVLASSWAA